MILTTIFSILVGLISIGSPVAFNDVISLTLASLYSSYFVACALLLWRRCSGSIKTVAETLPSDSRHINTNLPGSVGNLVWGPWRVPGVAGILINIVACICLLIIPIFTYWPVAVPVAVPVAPATMNYSSLVMGLVGILSTIYYVLWAHKTYSGPVVNTEFST